MTANIGVLKYAKDPLVEEWLGSVAGSTAKKYGIVFLAFLEWVEDGNSVLELDGYQGSLPCRLLELQRDLNRNGERRKLILRAVYSYVKEVGGERRWRAGYRRKVISTVRSFFLYHLDENGFPRESSRRMAHVLKSSLRKVEKSLSLFELKQVAIKSSPMYRAVIKCMLASGMGEGEVIAFSNRGMGELREAMDNPVGDGVIEIYLGARKGNVDGDFYVYIGGGAYGELRNWLKVREGLEEKFRDPDLRARRVTPIDREFPASVFVTNKFTPLSKSGFYSYFSRKMMQLGFIQRDENGGTGSRYNKNPHQIRSLFKTQWSKSRVNPDVGEYFMGHVVDSLDYNRVHDDRDYRIEEYRKAIPYVDLDHERAFGKVDEGEVDTLSTRVRELEAQLKIERRNTIEKDMEFRDLMEEVKWMKPILQSMIDEKKERDRIRESSMES